MLMTTERDDNDEHESHWREEYQTPLDNSKKKYPCHRIYDIDEQNFHVFPFLNKMTKIFF